MKLLVRLAILSTVLIITEVNAQDFQGIATYKTQRKIDIKVDSTQVSSEMHSQMMAAMKKQFQKTFKLSFTKEESIYKQEEELNKPTVGMGSGIEVIAIGGGGGSDVLYKNTKEHRFSNKVDTYGKIFLVKDSINSLGWKLESDTKFIGQYTCYKATFTKMVEKPRTIVNTDSDEDIDLDAEPEMEERTVTAWYTPQIPINNGPDDYQGLPGLILEVHDGKLNIICSKIVLNPDKKIDIVEPTKGKVINQEEFDKVMDKKQKEMMERYRPRKGNRNGDNIEIRIGG